MGRVAAAEEAEGKRVAGVIEDGPALGGKVASALRKMRDMGGDVGVCGSVLVA